MPSLVLDGKGLFLYVIKFIAVPDTGGDMFEQEKQIISSLPKTYEPRAVEGKWYRFWEEGGYFEPNGNTNSPTFEICMSPPHRTGSLHLCHAITATIQHML